MSWYVATACVLIGATVGIVVGVLFAWLWED